MGRVTIITATYKRPKELERAIKSVNAQTYEDWEHIIVSDGKSKKNKEIAGKYADKRRKYIEIKHSGSDAKPKNEAIRQATGEYIAYLDDDNEYLPGFLETMMTEIDIGEDDVVYADMRIFKKGDTEGERAIAMDFDAQFLLNRSFIDNNSVVHRKECVEYIGGWDETLPRFKDWNIFVRMSKAGFKFRHIPIYLTKYHLTKGNSAEKYPVKTWEDPDTGITFFDPTWFKPSSCYIWGPWLGTPEPEARVAIFTITKDRLEYTKHMYKSMVDSTKHPFDWFVVDNGSTDGTKDWLQNTLPTYAQYNKNNEGISQASNDAVDAILHWTHSYEIILKVDNDVLFLTKGWLKDFVDLWKRNHKLYIGPYPEGLVDSPGGPWRVGVATIGDEYVEVTQHVSGMCTFVDAKAYHNFYWKDKFLHGNQDMEFSEHARKQGYMPCIIPRHRIQHMNTRVGQEKDYPEYFELRKYEKTHEAPTGTTK